MLVSPVPLFYLDKQRLSNLTTNQPRPLLQHHMLRYLTTTASNPFALVEAILGRKLNLNDAATAGILSHDELFDMKFDSVLFAGLQLGNTNNSDTASPIAAKDMHTLMERDLLTPNLSRIQKLTGLHQVGFEDLGDIAVKHAYMQDGALRIVLQPRSLGKMLSNSALTETLAELATPFRQSGKDKTWTPPNTMWEEIAERAEEGATKFNNPVQGAAANSWLIAALMSVF